ncbi:MAG: AAA family ATPase, partial [Serpentinimonas sp.]|nr:AAA family ATPase [Serpentinimonas sp.]
MTDSTFIRRVILRNYKSIARCDITLRPLSYLVGQNGAGKSNFLDALHFVRDALTGSLDNALSERGGLDEVRRRSSGHPNHVSIQLDLRLSDGRSALYAFKIGALSNGSYEVQS